jgi:CBS domain-containing protein
MKVKNVMTRDVVPVRTDETLTAAAMVMWNHDCGVVPVVDNDRRVAGILTDRDICMATAMQGRKPSDVRAGECMSKIVFSVHEEDNVQDALDMMADNQLRRLPVVDAEGGLAGIISISDIARNSDKGKSKKHISHGEAMRVLKAVSAPHAPRGHAVPIHAQHDMAATTDSVPESHAASGDGAA